MKGASRQLEATDIYLLRFEDTVVGNEEARRLENTYEMKGASRQLEATDIYLLRFEDTVVGNEEARTFTAAKASVSKLTLAT
ncbi:unnamed protein product [Heligmosomoides polygyrus]|uniref:SF4 helicase domain-containing protein n=1 Tax=Heligmosomoides polygyrus TaxID=6339 RepID=A0A183FEV0_HELPZ|nr:unnamed protein product [Heligmosomoides polygyrus]